jgi:hypothetical protein
VIWWRGGFGGRIAYFKLAVNSCHRYSNVCGRSNCIFKNFDFPSGVVKEKL